MQILINDKALDVTLEREENLGDVYDALCSWMKDAGMFPLSLVLDSQEFDLGKEADWKFRLIQDVDSFELQAGNINSLRQQELMTVLDYIVLLRNCIARSDRDALAKAAEEYAYIAPVLPSLLQMNTDDFQELFGAVDRYIHNAKSWELDDKKMSNLDTGLDQIRYLILERLQESMQPIRDLHACAQVLEEIFPQLQEAGIALQTGEEKTAYTLVLKITEIVSKMLRITEVLAIDHSSSALKGLRTDIHKLGEIINEMNEAMKIGDIVVLADILEYDLYEILSKVVGELRNVDIRAS